MRTTRKRAIQRARHMTRMGTIEIGDMVEVIYNSSSGHDIGTLGEVTGIENSIIGKLIEVHAIRHFQLVGLVHRVTDLKLIKKGSN